MAPNLAKNPPVITRKIVINHGAKTSVFIIIFSIALVLSSPTPADEDPAPAAEKDDGAENPAEATAAGSDTTIGNSTAPEEPAKDTEEDKAKDATDTEKPNDDTNDIETPKVDANEAKKPEDGAKEAETPKDDTSESEKSKDDAKSETSKVDAKEAEKSKDDAKEAEEPKTDTAKTGYKENKLNQNNEARKTGYSSKDKGSQSQWVGPEMKEIICKGGIINFDERYGEVKETDRDGRPKRQDMIDTTSVGKC